MSRSWPVRELAKPPAGSGLEAVKGDQGLPLLGHTLDYIRFGSDLGRERYARLGPVSWMGAFGTQVVVVAGPAATQSVLANKDKAFSQDGWNFLIDAFFHRGLMLMSFERAPHAPPDHAGGVRPSAARRIRRPGGATVHGRRRQLVDRAARAAVPAAEGARPSTSPPKSSWAAAARRTAAPSTTPSWQRSARPAPLSGCRCREPGTARACAGREVLESYFAASYLPTARRPRGRPVRSAVPRADRRRRALHRRDVINHMIFLMMAAHDTSTITTAAWPTSWPSTPSGRTALRQESLALGEGPADIDALERLGTLDLVIKESLRLVAPVPLVMRKTVKPTEVEGHFIPADTLVAVAPAVNHFDPACWTDPDDFDPGRFEPDRAEDKSHRVRMDPVRRQERTSASACTSASWRSRRSCTRCCAHAGGRWPMTTRCDGTTPRCPYPSTACPSSSTRLPDTAS